MKLVRCIPVPRLISEELEVVVAEYRHYLRICLEGSEENYRNNRCSPEIPTGDLRNTIRDWYLKKDVRNLIRIACHEFLFPEPATNCLQHSEHAESACYLLLPIYFSYSSTMKMEAKYSFETSG
jgi:hypothetical protein